MRILSVDGLLKTTNLPLISVRVDTRNRPAQTGKPWGTPPERLQYMAKSA